MDVFPPTELYDPSDGSRDVLARFNRLLSEKFNCRTFFRTRENLQTEAPLLLESLDQQARGLLPDRPYFERDSELIFPIRTRPTDPIAGYLVAINVNAEHLPVITNLILDIGIHMVQLHLLRNQLLKLEHHLEDQRAPSANVLPFRRRLAPLLPKIESRHLLLTDVPRMLIEGSDPRGAEQIALLCHELLGNVACLRSSSLATQDKIPYASWESWEGVTLFIDDFEAWSDGERRQFQEHLRHQKRTRGPTLIVFAGFESLNWKSMMSCLTPFHVDLSSNLTLQEQLEKHLLVSYA